MATRTVKRARNGNGAVEDRPSQLLDIASRLFAMHGYAGTSLRDIAEEAQITKAALYYHFPNKEALYQQILVDNLDSLIRRVAAAVDGGKTATEKVRNFMLTSADVYQEDREGWMAGSNAFWSSMGPEIRRAAISRRDKYEKLLRSCVAEGVAAGEFRAVDVALAGRLLLSAMNQLTRWYSPKGKLSPRDVIEHYLDVVLLGLTARPAGKG